MKTILIAIALIFSMGAVAQNAFVAPLNGNHSTLHVYVNSGFTAYAHYESINETYPICRYAKRTDKSVSKKIEPFVNVRWTEGTDYIWVSTLNEQITFKVLSFSTTSRTTTVYFKDNSPNGYGILHYSDYYEPRWAKLSYDGNLIKMRH